MKATSYLVKILTYKQRKGSYFPSAGYVPTHDNTRTKCRVNFKSKSVFNKKN